MMQHVEILREQLSSFSRGAVEQAEIQVKSETYIEKERDLVQKDEPIGKPDDTGEFQLRKTGFIKHGSKAKVLRIQPRTLSRASRISSVNPVIFRFSCSLWGAKH